MREIPGNCESFISVNIGLFHTARALRWGLSPGCHEGSQDSMQKVENVHCKEEQTVLFTPRRP